MPDISISRNHKMTKLHIKKPPFVRCEMTIGFSVELPRDSGFDPDFQLSEDQKDDILSRGI